MDDFRVSGSSLFDERPDLGAHDARRRKKPRHAAAEASTDDAVELSSEPEVASEEPAQDFYAPSPKNEDP